MFIARSLAVTVLSLWLSVPAPAQLKDPYGDLLPEGAVARYGTQRFRQGYYCNAAQFSPDGRWVAAASSGQGVCVWDAKTGTRVMQFLPTAHSYTLDFSRDGKYLATTGGR
ncbi:MAG: WD40 repeat domain-containing protein, partial [Gemmataceae bacterium]